MTRDLTWKDVPAIALAALVFAGLLIAAAMPGYYDRQDCEGLGGFYSSATLFESGHCDFPSTETKEPQR